MHYTPCSAEDGKNKKEASKEKNPDETRLPAKVIRREQCPVIVEETKSERGMDRRRSGQTRAPRGVTPVGHCSSLHPTRTTTKQSLLAGWHHLQQFIHNLIQAVFYFWMLQLATDTKAVISNYISSTAHLTFYEIVAGRSRVKTRVCPNPPHPPGISFKCSCQLVSLKAFLAFKN